MSSQPEERPYSDSHLDSPEYRKRLLRKLNTLIAVLEVACAKVRRSLAGPDPDVERLMRIQKNLKETLQVCLRAKRALEHCDRLPADLPPGLALPAAEAAPEASGDQAPVRPGGAGLEMSSLEEEKKFELLGPIDPREVRSCDLDELCNRLLTDI
jgi:hypothetical protein